MKRRIEMCRRCQFFDEIKHIADRIVRAKDDSNWIGMKTEYNGVKEKSLFKCALEERLMSEGSFNVMEVPDDCIMKTEYCVFEWNNEKEKREWT